MLPFCGYNFGDYFRHWLTIGEHADPTTLPKLFYVNWFRKDSNGEFLWPGFGDNSRVLKWVYDRCAGGGSATETPIGWVPSEGELDVDGLGLDADVLAELVRVDDDEWRAELSLIRDHFDAIGDRLPNELRDELAALESRLS